MTTFAQSPRLRTPQTAAPSTLVVEWALVLEGAPATLAVTITGGTASAALSTLAGTRPLAAAQVVETVDGPLHHLDSPGLLSVTLRRDADGARALLFARTPLLDSLGVRGGCVERPGVFARD